MTNTEKSTTEFEDEPDCGIDAESDTGYWLEECDKRTIDNLIKMRKEYGLSPELLSEIAPIPLAEYLLIEKGKRKMTNGDSFRIDTAIINYRKMMSHWLKQIKNQTGIVDEKTG